MKKNRCNPYSGGKIPPCSAFLGNEEPIVKYGSVIYRNENRVYSFISTLPNTKNNVAVQSPINTTPINTSPFISTNIQVSIDTFIIGLFINKVQCGLIKYDENMSIHSNKAADDFIHKMIKKSPEVIMDFSTRLSLIISNHNAILPLYTYDIQITPFNFYILFLLNRFEGNPGLFFANNSFATEDPINLTLAALNIFECTL